MVTIAYNNDPDLRSATLLAGGGEGGFWKCSCLGHENSALAASPTMSAAHGYSELKDLPCPKRQKARLLGQQSLELSCPGHAFPGSKRSTQRPNNRSRPMGNDRKTHAHPPSLLSAPPLACVQRCLARTYAERASLKRQLDNTHEALAQKRRLLEEAQ